MKVYAPNGLNRKPYEFYADPDEVNGGNFLPYHLTPDQPHQSYAPTGGRLLPKPVHRFSISKEKIRV